MKIKTQCAEIDPTELQKMEDEDGSMVMVTVPLLTDVMGHRYDGTGHCGLCGLPGWHHDCVPRDAQWFLDNDIVDYEVAWLEYLVIPITFSLIDKCPCMCQDCKRQRGTLTDDWSKLQFREYLAAFVEAT